MLVLVIEIFIYLTVILYAMSRTVEFHRLEDYTDPRKSFSVMPEVTVSFDTKQHGYLQIKCDGEGLNQISHEPDLHMFKRADQRYIERVAHIVFRMVYDAPAATDRFEDERFIYE